MKNQMKYKLLSVSKYPLRKNHHEGVNIGDYVQALAASQFYPHVDGFIDRDEELYCYEGENCKMIMNGWYMHRPENWPPTDRIDPLFVAFHLNESHEDKMLTPAGIAYLKQYEPIGCRDLHTLRILQGKGIESYFSGCLTLTLGQKYHSKLKNGKTYIVDPLYDGILTVANVLRSVITTICNPGAILRLVSKKELNFYGGKYRIRNILKIALYFREYSKIFSKDIIVNSEYITQQSVHYMKDFKTDSDRLNEAERLVKLYAGASLIITSRLHCALPALGLGTPVIFISNENDSSSSLCRFVGLKELMNVVSLRNGHLVPQFDTTLPVSMKNIPANKNSWRELANSLIERCRNFVNGDKQ